ncbi:MAG TPA: ferritin-like domain-containing protein [Longimicrobiales bacterium]|nr:ferritin-like domain-containing protein [Longimicrobiales bacterium]
MAQSNELLTTWLRDAHAMEKSLIPVLQNHADDAKDHPDVRERTQRHLEETRRHAEIVAQCLERLDAKPSRMKSAWSSVMGRFQAMSSEPFRDELMKNFISDYATEQLEIASYKALIAAARAMGQEEIARSCEEILSEEEDMARWLDQHMASAARESIAEDASRA